MKISTSSTLSTKKLEIGDLILNSSTTEVTESSISHRNGSINDNTTLNSGVEIRKKTRKKKKKKKKDGTDQKKKKEIVKEKFRNDTNKTDGDKKSTRR